jgi:hypothetical protein
VLCSVFYGKRTDVAFRGKRTVYCPAGVWTTIIDNWFARMPATFQVKLRPDDPAAPIGGEFEVKASLWVFPQGPITGPLQPVQLFERGWLNTFYRVRVRPAHSVEAEID